MRAATPRECFALKVLLSRCKFEGGGEGGCEGEKKKQKKRENSVFNNAQCETAQSNIHF